MQTWENVYRANTAHEKASIFQKDLMQSLDKCVPEKITTFSSDDQSWITPQLKQLERCRKRVFRKNRRSSKWTHLNSIFEEKCDQAKENYKTSNPGHWYSKLKRMSSHDQNKGLTQLLINLKEFPTSTVHC